MWQDPERTKDPVEFVQRLLAEKDKYAAIIAQSFGRDKAFQNALNQAFEHFINLNQRSPEFISLFMDDKLRKGLKVCHYYALDPKTIKACTIFVNPKPRSLNPGPRLRPRNSPSG